MTTRFRFAIQLSQATSRNEWIAQAREAERLGYDVIVVPDHIGDQLSPFPALVSAAEATESIRLGTFVIDNDFRHPLLVAQEAATLGVLTGNRFELGIGAGWMGQDYTRLGMTFDPGPMRVDRLQEAVEIIQRSFAGEAFSFEGEHYRVDRATPYPPVERKPPLLIGGGGRRILQYAAKHADIVSVFLPSMPDRSGFDMSELRSTRYQRKTGLVRRIADEAGRDPELNVLLQHFEVTRDRARVAKERSDEFGTTAEDLLALPFELIGTVDQIVQDLVERRERLGISYITVFERFMHDFAPVIEQLAGK